MSLWLHAREELDIDLEALARPGQAALTSAVSFALGAALPLAATAIAPHSIRIAITLAFALIALGSLGAWRARLDRASVSRAVLRVGIGGADVMGHHVGARLLLSAAAPDESGRIR